MIITLESQEIRRKLQRALETGDHSEVDAIPLKMLHEAKNNLMSDLGTPYHDLLVDKIRGRESSAVGMAPQATTQESNFAKNRDVFIAHRFEEGQLIRNLKSYITRKGYRWQEGKRENLGSISEDILGKIRACGFFVVVMTRNHELKDGKFTTSSWLIEEKGAALAFGHRPVMMVEDCIDRHYVGFLQSDDELIYFSRDNFASKVKEAVSKIENTYGLFSSRADPQQKTIPTAGGEFHDPLDRRSVGILHDGRFGLLGGQPCYILANPSASIDYQRSLPSEGYLEFGVYLPQSVKEESLLICDANDVDAQENFHLILGPTNEVSFEFKPNDSADCAKVEWKHVGTAVLDIDRWHTIRVAWGLHGAKILLDGYATHDWPTFTSPLHRISSRFGIGKVAAGASRPAAVGVGIRDLRVKPL